MNLVSESVLSEQWVRCNNLVFYKQVSIEGLQMVNCWCSAKVVRSCVEAQETFAVKGLRRCWQLQHASFLLLDTEQ
jgi:hypothetical protein